MKKKVTIMKNYLPFIQSSKLPNNMKFIFFYPHMQYFIKAFPIMFTQLSRNIMNHFMLIYESFPKDLEDPVVVVNDFCLLLFQFVQKIRAWIDRWILFPIGL